MPIKLWWLEYEPFCSYCGANRLKQGSWKELLNSQFWCWFGTRILKGISNMAQMYAEGLFLTRYVVWLILTQIEVQWAWYKMVLKGVTGYTFCYNIANNTSTGLKIDTMLAPIVFTSGVSFSRLPPLLWKLPCFLCVFDTRPNLLIDGHNGPAGAQWIEKFTGWHLVCQEIHQIEPKILNSWRFR